jgi:hypothetical protein
MPAQAASSDWCSGFHVSRFVSFLILLTLLQPWLIRHAGTHYWGLKSHPVVGSYQKVAKIKKLLFGALTFLGDHFSWHELYDTSRLQILISVKNWK